MPAVVDTTSHAPTIPKRGKRGPKKYKYRFRLLAGSHRDNQGDVESGEAPVRNFQATPPRQGQPGDFPEFGSDDPLDEMFNGQHPSMKKFERITEVERTPTDPTKRIPYETLAAFLQRQQEVAAKASQQVEQAKTAISKMDKEELLAFADEEDIEIGDVKTVADLRAVILKALSEGV